MPPIRLDAAAGLTAAEVAHTRFSTFPASTALAEVTAWFASSDSHQMALLADADGRFAGRVLAGDVPAGADPARPAAELAQRGATVAPDEPAARAEALALASGARRVPVVDLDGRLVGIVAVTTDLQGFCGTDG
jgi:CBS-domain-containing membrane protein